MGIALNIALHNKGHYIFYLFGRMVRADFFLIINLVNPPPPPHPPQGINGGCLGLSSVTGEHCILFTRD